MPSLSSITARHYSAFVPPTFINRLEIEGAFCVPNVTGVNLVIYGWCGFGHFRWFSVVLAFDDLFSSW